ncbi:MAG: PAS domain S-box protein [Gemmataceae bacterium]|nr:PAS domain S-box protein [Gemmataceae bacterium]
MDIERQFLAFADLRPEALLLLRGGTVLAASRGVERKLGLAPSLLRGRALADLVSDPPEEVARYLSACARSREPVLGSVSLRRQPGPFPCRCDGAVYLPRTEGTEPIVMLGLVPKEAAASRFVALTQRIDSLSREIARRTRAEQGEREQRELLRVTLASIGDAVIATDAAGNIAFLNAVAAAMTGWTEAESMGRPMAEVFRIVNEVTREVGEDPVARVLREGITVGLANHTVLIHRDGSERPIEDSAAPIRDGQGKVAGVVLVFRDATERLRTEQELREKARAAEALQEQLARRVEELAEADRRKDEFLALLGHELRNPLAPIRTAVKLLELRPTDAEVVAQARGMIGRQAAHMTRLVDELLDASRIARGKIVLKAEQLDLGDLARLAAEDQRGILDAAGLSLAVTTAPAWVEGDRARLTQVVGNLIHNASKFTDPGGRVEVRVRAESAEAVLEVADTGIGLEASALPRLFEEFAQVDATIERSTGGLGLGLAIVRRVAELHGGRASASSAGLGRGSTFVIRLPLRKEAAQAPAPPPAAFQVGAKRVLVVEDGADAAESLRLFLSLNGFEAEVARTGPEGVEKARQGSFDAVICDLGLPGMSGFEVARGLRADPATAGLLLVCLSGYSQDEDRRQALEAGFDAHHAKGEDLDPLVALLASRR